MKKIFVLTAIITVLAAGIFCLSGCQNEDENLDEVYTDELSSYEELDSTDFVGEITYLYDTFFYMEIYESDKEITDYTAVNVSELLSTSEEKPVTINEDAEFLSVKDGTLISATQDGLSEGDFIAVTENEDGIQQIIILESDDMYKNTEDYDDYIDEEIADNIIEYDELLDNETY